MIIGEIIFPRIIPNLNHTLLSGVKIFEFNKPSIKKVIEKIKNKRFNFSLFNSGYKDKIKKKNEKYNTKTFIGAHFNFFFIHM